MKQYPQNKLEKEWIHSGITNETIDWAKSFGQYLQERDRTGPLTTSQIRKFFGELKRIQADPKKYQDDIPMLKAKLAYAVGRDVNVGRNNQIFNKTKIKEFYEEIERGVDAIREGNENDLINLVKVVEAIVAYHKYFGGK